MNAAKKSADMQESRGRGQVQLDRHYRQIGISAVAAAVQFQKEPKKAAYVWIESRD